RVLEASGRSSVSEGQQLKVVAEESPRGHQVTKVVEFGQETARAAPAPRRSEAPAVATGEQKETTGSVRWYNSEKGFGFISPDDGAADIFVHATALIRSGVSAIEEGQKVRVEYGQGKKGLEVLRLGIA